MDEKDNAYETWKKSTNENPELVKHDDVIVNKTKHVWYKILATLFIIFLFVFGAGILYLAYYGKLVPIINNTINPAFYSSTNITNDYDFSPSTSNDYHFNVNSNVTIPQVIYLNTNITCNCYGNNS